MIYTDKQGNKLVIQEENSLIFLTPKNGSTLIYNIKDIIKCTEKEIAELVITPENPLEAYHHFKSCPHCKKEFKCNILGYNYVEAVGETEHCPYCGGKLKWREKNESN